MASDIVFERIKDALLYASMHSFKTLVLVVGGAWNNFRFA